MSEKNDRKPSSGGYADEIIEGHSYDGIVEYDNPMPLWWKLVFVLTIIWSPIYVGAIELGFIDTYDEALHAEDVYWDERIAELKKNQPELTPERIKTEMINPERADAGKALFAANCAACHGDSGEGLIGPNLTDKFWLHGGDQISIYNTIDKGVLDKGMPPWGGTLGPEGVLDVGSYLNSIRDTNVAGKAPQGEPYVEGAEGEGEGGEGAEGGADAGAEGAAGEGAEGDGGEVGEAAEAGEGAAAAEGEAKGGEEAAGEAAEAKPAQEAK